MSVKEQNKTTDTLEGVFNKTPEFIKLFIEYLLLMLLVILVVDRFASRWSLLVSILAPVAFISWLLFYLKSNINSILERLPESAQKLIHGRLTKGGGAAWATFYDLAPLLNSSGSQRLYLGKAKSSWNAEHDIYLADDNHLAITATIGQGKTTGYIIPMLLKSDPKANIVCVDIKGELYETTAGYRNQLAREHAGKVTVYDPDNVTRSPLRVPWDITAMCGDFQTSVNIAEILVSGNQSGSDGNSIWYGLAKNGLAVLLNLAAVSGTGMEMVVKMVAGKDAAGITKQAEINKSKLSDIAIKSLQGWLGTYQEAIDSVFMTIQASIAAFASPNVLRASAKEGSIDFTKFVGGESNTHYICVSSSKQSTYASVIVSHIDQAITAAVELAEKTPGNALPNRLYVLIDEAGNLTKLPKLKNYLATLRSMNIRIITVWQNVSQIQALYGNEDANHILDSSGSRLFLGGSSDTSTLDLMQKLCGDKKEHKVSTSKSKGSAVSTSESDEYRPLLSTSEARQLNRGEGILISSNIPPVKIKAVPWFKQPSMVTKSKIPVPSAESSA